VVIRLKTEKRERKGNKNINNMKNGRKKKTNTYKSQEGMVINALSLPVIHHP
jgi:hypothetical protein